MSGKQPKVVSIVGARPQFIKLAPLARFLRGKCRHSIIHSGQHYDFEMSRVFFQQLQILNPDMNLEVGSGSHGRQTGRILERCEKELTALQPDMVLVYGDTNTTLAGALAAAKLSLPVGHVEAGLRSFRKTMPEEINRVAADHVSDLLFYPTPAARKNLLGEGISNGLIRSGDLMYEILDSCLPKITRLKDVFKANGIKENDYILITLHRAENADNSERLEAFVTILKKINRPMLFLAHPRTLKNLRRFKLINRLRHIDGLVIGRPQPYLETLKLISGAAAIMTDSGGVQKEAAFLRRPCLTMRPETEWVETVKSGANALVDMSWVKIRRALQKAPGSKRKPEFRIRGRNPSEIIGTAVLNFVQNHK